MTPAPPGNRSGTISTARSRPPTSAPKRGASARDHERDVLQLVHHRSGRLGLLPPPLCGGGVGWGPQHAPCIGRRASSIMTAFWTVRADNRLLTEWGRGRSDAEIARILGTRPAAVAARRKELRRYLRRSDVEDWRRANVVRAEAARARTEQRLGRERKLIAAMAKAIRGGMPRGEAMLRAYKAGATWRVIGEI